MSTMQGRGVAAFCETVQLCTTLYCRLCAQPTLQRERERREIDTHIHRTNVLVAQYCSQGIIVSFLCPGIVLLVEETMLILFVVVL